jgi:uncharacterized protein (DUF2267 family)
MSNIIEELRAGAELEEAYDADGIIRTGYQMSLRWRAAAEIEKLRNASDLDGELISNMHDEAERLRALLREAVKIDEGDFRINVDEWMVRVREALGDENT